MAKEVTEIIIKGEVEGLSAYKSVQRAVKDLKDELSSMNLEGKKETDLYRDKQSRLNVLSDALKRAKASQNSFNLETKEGINQATRYRNTLKIGSAEWNKLGAEIDQAKMKLNNFNATTKTSSGGLLNMYKNLTVVTAGFVYAGARAKDFLVSSVQSFAQSELAAKKLENGLRNVGDLDMFDKLIEQADEFQGKTFFADEQIVNAQAMLSTFKLTGAEIEILIPRLLDMATSLEQTGQGQADLQQLAIQLGKATGGELVGGLKRYGVIMTKVQEEQLALAKGMERTRLIAEILDGNFKDLAVTAGDTTAGKIKILENQYDELKESIGEGFVEGITSMTSLGDSAEDTADSFGSLEIAAKGVGFAINALGITQVVGAFKLLDGTVKLVKDEFNAFKGILTDVTSLLSQSAPQTWIASIIAPVGTAIFKLSEMLGLINEAQNASINLPYSPLTGAPEDFGFQQNKRLFGNDLFGKTPTELFNRYKKKSNIGGSKGTGSTKGEEKDPFAELVEEIQMIIAFHKAYDTLTGTIINEELRRLENNKSLADTMEKQTKWMELQKSLQKDIFNLHKDDKPSITTSDGLFNRNAPLLVGTGIDPFKGSSDFGVIAMLMTEAFGTAKDDVNETLDAIRDMTSILGEGVSNFVSSLIDGFNSVLNLVGGIISLLNQIGSGGGIFSGLTSLLGIFLAPFTGGASLAKGAVPSFATGTDNFPGVGIVHKDELLVNRNVGSVISNANIEKMHSMMSAISRPSAPQINQSFTMGVDEKGWYIIHDMGKKAYGKFIKLQT